MTHLTRAVLALALALPAPALACGGFFCNNEAPVDQSGEKIVFAIDAEKEAVEVHVQIAYEGAAEDFAWVLPAPAEPELFLSSETLFTQLEWATAPQYMMDWKDEGNCNDEVFMMESDEAVADSDVALDDGAGYGGGGVIVVSTQRVGPYESITLQATSGEALLALSLIHI